MERPVLPRSGTSTSATERDVHFCQGVWRPVLPRSVMSSSTKEWDVHFCQGVQCPHQPRSGTPSSAKEWDVQFSQGVGRPVLPKSVMSTSAKDCDVPFSQSSQLDWVNSSAVLQSPHTRGPALVLQRSSLHYSHERFRFTHRYRRAWLSAHAVNDYFVYDSALLQSVPLYT